RQPCRSDAGAGLRSPAVPGRNCARAFADKRWSWILRTSQCKSMRKTIHNVSRHGNTNCIEEVFFCNLSAETMFRAVVWKLGTGPYHAVEAGRLVPRIRSKLIVNFLIRKWYPA